MLRGRRDYPRLADAPARPPRVGVRGRLVAPRWSVDCCPRLRTRSRTPGSSARTAPPRSRRRRGRRARGSAGRSPAWRAGRSSVEAEPGRDVRDRGRQLLVAVDLVDDDLPAEPVEPLVEGEPVDAPRRADELGERLGEGRLAGAVAVRRGDHVERVPLDGEGEVVVPGLAADHLDDAARTHVGVRAGVGVVVLRAHSPGGGAQLLVLRADPGDDVVGSAVARQRDLEAGAGGLAGLDEDEAVARARRSRES